MNLAALLAATVAVVGTYLLYTGLVLGWTSRRHRGGGRSWGRMAEPWQDFVAQVGLVGIRPVELLGGAASLAAVGGLAGLAVFGAVLPAVVVAVWVGVGWPLASCRVRRDRMQAAAQEAWPQILEEIRILTANLGRSVPQAVFEAGRRAPRPMRPGFEAAHREWLLSIDFERTIGVLKSRLADPTADAACETLLVAHQLGGSDLDRRLEALVNDRRVDVQGRKDARAAQAGVRFSRRFVLLVPCGMALVGTTIGTGRAAYRTTWGQMMVAAGLAVVAICWVWAGRLLKLPAEERVFR
ncbi:MAG TPA: hypothetical protein VGJ86_25705 [Acidimicrobiales bacterium]